MIETLQNPGKWHNVRDNSLCHNQSPKRRAPEIPLE
jgi:hypothetical protein